MNKTQIKTIFCFTVIATVAIACKLSKSPTPITFQTPDYTLTAIFSVLGTTPPGTTQFVQVSTATTAPTNSPQPPTQTMTANPTSTPTNPLPSPTPTITQSPTPAPTSTATPILRVSSVAGTLIQTPSINGTWDEWTSTQYPIRSVVFGYGNWSGADDLQASYRVGWDSKYLYLAVKVFDDAYAQNASGANLYKGDSIEVLLSTNPNADSADLGLIASDYQIGISPGRPSLGTNMEAYLWYPAAKTGSLSSVAIGVVSMEGGYRIELAIPWQVFGITPVKGQVLGFAVSVSDNDSPDSNIQQTLVSSVPKRNLVDPTSWGLLILK